MSRHLLAGLALVLSAPAHGKEPFAGVRPILFAGPPVGRLAWTDGPIEVRRLGEADYEPVRAGPPMPLRRGDRVRTAAEATAIVSLTDGSVVELSPRSVLLLEHDQPSFVSLLLLQGRAYASVSVKDGRRFQIATSEAVAAAEAGELAVESHRDGRTAVGVDFGMVTVTGPGRPVRLRGGQRADIIPNRAVRVEATR